MKCADINTTIGWITVLTNDCFYNDIKQTNLDIGEQLISSILVNDYI